MLHYANMECLLLECGGWALFSKEMEIQSHGNLLVDWGPISALNGYKSTSGKKGVFALPVYATHIPQCLITLVVRK